MSNAENNIYYESGPGYVTEGPLAGTLRAEGENRPSRPTHTILSESGENPIAFSHKGIKAVPSDKVTPTLRAGHNGQSVYIPNRRTGGLEEHKDISPTLLAFMGTGGGNVPLRFRKETLVRRLTPIECERLQGFPDNWTDSNSDTHRYRQMGNAVAVPVVDWVIAGIVAVHNE